MSEFRGFKHTPPPVRWPADLLRRIFAPRQAPRIAPGVGMFDEPAACVRINAQWASHILGALEVLNQDDAWQGDAVEVFRARQEVERLFTAIVEGNCSEVGETLAAEFRINNCILEYSYDGVTWAPVAGWESFAAACFTGPAGPPGADGEDGQGVTGVVVNTLDCGTSATGSLASGVLTLGIPRGCDGAGITGVVVNTLDCNATATGSLAGGVLTLGIPRGCDGADALPPLIPPGTVEPAPTGNDNEICGGVLEMTSYLFDYANYWLDLREAESNGAKVVVRLIGLFPFLEPLEDSILELLSAMGDYGISLLRTQVNDPDFQQEYRCGLYNLIYPMGTYTEAFHDAISNGTVPFPIPNQKAWMDYMLYTVGYQRLNTMYQIGTAAPSDVCEVLCASDYDWTRNYDFTGTPPANWHPYSGNVFTEYGLRGGLPYFSGSNIENLYWYPYSNCTIERVEIHTTNYTPATGTTVGYIQIPQGTQVAGIADMNASFADGVITWTGSAPMTSAQRMVILLRDQITEPAGTRIYISRIVISGSGTPPEV